MQVWHTTADTRRLPEHPAAGERVTLRAGSWPIEAGQSVWLDLQVEPLGGSSTYQRIDCAWEGNRGSNSYWSAEIGPFARGTTVSYEIRGRSGSGEVTAEPVSFRVRPRLHVALLWHQHQPFYRVSDRTTSALPWVRLHAIRSYYSMTALLADHPRMHATINLTASLLEQIEAYADERTTDRALELTLRPAEALDKNERVELLTTFFEADWHQRVFPHPRYRELFTKRVERAPFTAQDLRDLQMWFNLAWFGTEFRTGEVHLVTGETASVRRFMDQGQDFSTKDVEHMIAEQQKILRAIIPLHRALQDRGQVEISTSPFAHPILPLLLDTDQATIDRAGAVPPPRFAYPEDAEGQVALAIADYRRWFGRPPRGMWPAEGAVSPGVGPVFARQGIRWIASDRGVLAQSGRWGYPAVDPRVLCRPYRLEEAGHALAIFFRHDVLSNLIAFDLQKLTDPDAAAATLVARIKEEVAGRVPISDDHVLTLALDGENTVSGYADDGRLFLAALYRRLEADDEIQTVTFAEYLDGSEAIGVAPHPLGEQDRVHDLFTGSWIDEPGSRAGVDLGTWIGESEENLAWFMLLCVRLDLAARGVTPGNAPAAFRALYAAEGSDWFWWLGDDQTSGSDAEFETLFRGHLASVYRCLGLEPPEFLYHHLVSHPVLWTFPAPARQIQPGDDLVVRTNCPGTLEWQVGDDPRQESPLFRVVRGTAGFSRHELRIRAEPPGSRDIRLRFRCGHEGCHGDGPCCRSEWSVVHIGSVPGLAHLARSGKEQA
jgi:alpha-amylase/alpha-mannosidase (GH57 family)